MSSSIPEPIFDEDSVQGLPPTPSASASASATPDIPSSRSSSPREVVEVTEVVEVPTLKKKKKKKSKKSKTKEEKQEPKKEDDSEKPILCISRNKHWRYISSYHGPWLQLPLELLESLLVLNMDPSTFAIPDQHRHAHHTHALPSVPPSSSSATISFSKNRGVPFMEISPPPSPHPSSFAVSTAVHPHAHFDTLGRPPPPPIDPGIFRSVTGIRRLVDEASDLAVRAASGMSSPNMSRSGGSSNFSYGISPWAAAQSFGINPMGEGNNNGRNAVMSATRIHRLRVLAVQKLAEAYKTDEIAASVMVMQGASALDDIAEKVLKVDPNDIDARYVHFFHEKIPSRQLAESTTTTILDELIAAHPNRLEFYRTRGVVRCFRDEYQLAVRDFTHALKEVRTMRKARHAHMLASDPTVSKAKSKKGKKVKTQGQAPPDGTSVAEGEGDDGPSVHPSVLPDAPEPIEHQVLFLRGAAYFQHVIYLIQSAIFELEEITKTLPPDGTELRLRYLDYGKYGGVEVGNADGPLGSDKGAKLQAYRSVLNEPSFREQINTLLKKCIRDHEKFLSHFNSIESTVPVLSGDLAQQMHKAFFLTESLRPGGQSHAASSNVPPMFTTYHPLLVESHFSILLATLLMGDFAGLLPAFARAATLVDGLEGYPVFLPARSMAQAEFIEVLERLAGGWKTGIMPHSYSSERLAVTLSRSSLTQDLPPEEKPGKNGKVSSSSPSLEEQLDSVRILLAPVAQRQKERASAASKGSGSDKKKHHIPINIPLHGPRVEIVLAWLGAVHLPELNAMTEE